MLDERTKSKIVIAPPGMRSLCALQVRRSVASDYRPMRGRACLLLCKEPSLTPALRVLRSALQAAIHPSQLPRFLGGQQRTDPPSASIAGYPHAFHALGN